MPGWRSLNVTITLPDAFAVSYFARQQYDASSKNSGDQQCLSQFQNLYPTRFLPMYRRRRKHFSLSAYFLCDVLGSTIRSLLSLANQAAAFQPRFRNSSPTNNHSGEGKSIPCIGGRPDLERKSFVYLLQFPQVQP